MSAWDSALSSIIDVGGAFIQNDWNKRSAQRQMDFQKEMSDTAIQRRMADMRAAGINPMLAYSDGASSPAGSSYSASNPFQGFSSSARDSLRTKQEIAESRSRENLNNNSARKEFFLGNIAESQSVAARSLRPIKERVMEWLNEKGNSMFDDVESLGKRGNAFFGSSDKSSQRFTPSSNPVYFDTVPEFDRNGRRIFRDSDR